MALHTADSFETRACRLLGSFMPRHEEHAPLPHGASPSTAIAVILIHLARAADQLGDAGEAEQAPSLLDVAVSFAWVTLSCLAAVPLFRPDDLVASALKDALLVDLDQRASVWAREHEGWQKLDGEDFLRAVTAALGEAAICAPGLDAADTVDPELFDQGSEDTDELRRRAVDSLLEAALLAALALQRLEELHESRPTST